ncbi:Rieske 2Fe-2S domain-containing protein [Clavibacter capsici]|uniref:Rieske 2Fe-2S domain-containing protein n=1 Tax=Clavibacter capsici TaxID=1874630 RepID=A0AAE6XS40_9MICO|nr:Rieske 2Fe-2S domain-containing protein [Clavibacter capsici]ALD13254.1 (2Fe-2S)-binding protein [Clavibacter capsici]QIS39597.1 Rieske 2Fe-2S domain-containing protein [Clavibacter capsici]QIS45436.1 Rieske 2Fe-2S domain-containing protein [Clavibacter capsici]
MRELKLVAAIARIEDAEALDPIVGRVKGVVTALLKPRALADLLHGVPFGHPLHPVAVLIPTGAWVSSAVLDLLPGNEKASRALVGVGVLSAAPSIASGYADWSQLHEQQMRVGIVHSAANALATGLYGLSWIQRARGKHTSGKVLGLAGLGLVSAGGFLGGHLAYRQAAGANHAEDVPHRFPVGWQELGRLDELPDGRLAKRDVAGLPVLVRRHGMTVDALSDTCSHLSAPLDEGTLGTDPKTGEACVTCPWHESVFSLRTGEVIHGPATAPQPRFETRVTGGLVEVRLPNAG